jgi:hypothetical protein
MTLISIPKNILLVVVSIVIWHTPIGFLQIIGYTIALLGLLYYWLSWEAIKAQWGTIMTWAKDLWESPYLDESRLSLAVKRTIVTAFLALDGLMHRWVQYLRVTGYRRHYGQERTVLEEI